MFNNRHDRRSFIPATLATVGPDRAVEHSPLAVEGSRQVLFADLNRDGFLDVVFRPNASGVQTTRRLAPSLESTTYSRQRAKRLTVPSAPEHTPGTGC